MLKITDWKDVFPDFDNLIHRDDFIWIELDCRYKTFKIVNDPC